MPVARRAGIVGVTWAAIAGELNFAAVRSRLCSLAWRKAHIVTVVFVCGAAPAWRRGNSSLLPIRLERRPAAAEARGRPPALSQTGRGRTAAGGYHCQCDTSLCWLMTKM